MKRQPLPRVREDPSNEERVSYATGIPRLQPWGGIQGLSCVLWIVVSALWIAEYRLERSRERKDG